MLFVWSFPCRMQICNAVTGKKIYAKVGISIFIFAFFHLDLGPFSN